MVDVRLTLVSASPRRTELLRKLKVPFDICPSHASERWGSEDAASLAIENARRKLERSSFLGDRSRLLLGADTIIQLDHRFLGKPAGPQSARRMLRVLSDRQHRVITGICLSGPAPRHNEPPFWVEAAAISHVTFQKLSPRQIREYLNSGEWRDKAGAYAIQGFAREFVRRLDGDFDNVVGLPVQLIHELLREKFIHLRLC